MGKIIPGFESAAENCGAYAEGPMGDDDLSDDISDLIGSPMRTAPVVPPASYKPVDFTEPCQKCGGTGRYRHLGPCFACKGKGKFTFKTSPEERAAKRTATHARQAAVAQEKRTELVDARAAFAAAHPAMIAWLEAAARRHTEGTTTFDFPVKMLNAINQYGLLTPNQLAAVERLMVRDKERATERAARVASAPVINVAPLVAAFDKAKEHALKMKAQIRFLKLRLDTFVFRPGSPGTEWDGMIFVKEGDNKIGHIKGGRFVRKFSCDDATEARVLAAAADPLAAAIAYGQKFSQCAICGRELTDPVSIERGIGPICAGNYGW